MRIHGASAHSAGPGFFCLSVCGFVGLWVCGVCVCFIGRVGPKKLQKSASFANFYQNRTNMGPKSSSNGSNLGHWGGTCVDTSWFVVFQNKSGRLHWVGALSTIPREHLRVNIHLVFVYMYFVYMYLYICICIYSLRAVRCTIMQDWVGVLSTIPSVNFNYGNGSFYELQLARVHCQT